MPLLANSANPILIFKHNNVAHGRANNSSLSPLVQNNNAFTKGRSLAHFFSLGCPKIECDIYLKDAYTWRMCYACPYSSVCVKVLITLYLNKMQAWLLKAWKYVYLVYMIFRTFIYFSLHQLLMILPIFYHLLVG